MKKHPFLIIDYQSTVKLTPSEKRLLNLWMYFSGEVIKHLIQKKIISVRGITRVHVSLLICGDKKIRNLNREFRNKDKVTDVLSFPSHDHLRGSHSFEKELFIGDLAICVPQARRQCQKFKISFMDEFIHLFFHGMIHLLGYDHEISAKEEKIMQRWENLL